MNTILTQIQTFGLVPVIALEDAANAGALAKALCDGGLPCAEVTFRTAAAEETIRIMTRNHPAMLIGAGTVLTTDHAERAVAAGAKFIVTPGFDPEIVEYCMKQNIPITPGIMTPSEAAQAVKFGLEVVKFFPAEAAGGLPMIQSLAAPYPMLKFMPTGGINTENLADYLKFGKIIACGGSWMVKSSLIAAQKFTEIENLTKEALAIVKSCRK